MSLSFLFVLVTFLAHVHGYIPAHPSNLTLQPSNHPNLHLQWHTNGSDWEVVSRQSTGLNASTVPVQGILVHFTEDNAGDEPTTTPWIAFMSCDSNSTHASNDTNIFTIAKRLGAQSAILYSLFSETCLINSGHQSSPFDIFTTQSLNASRHVEYEFGQFGPSSQTYYGNYNPTMLNDAAQAIEDSIASGHPAAPGFLFATLSAYNTNGHGGPGSGSQADANGTTQANTSDTNPNETGVAMIVLYAITGCVSALFCGVIVSGAIRAIRHPERYGPRRADPRLGGGQSRAGGLGRAILDTFPIVKFGSSGNSSPRPKDVESSPVGNVSSIVPPPSNSLPLAQISNLAEHDEHSREEAGVAAGEGAVEDSPTSAGTDHVDSPSRTYNADQEACVPASSHEIAPESMGRETCPICIVDFEEGDDLRVLPCEGKHRFHQTCVDPWLLELSGSCPICRQDFHALETIISGELENEAPSGSRNRDSNASTQQNRRFSRYLRFALGRQRSVSIGEQGSPPSPDI